MGSSFPFSSSSILSLTATYWLHSTIFIGGVWCFLRVYTGCSHTLRDRLWKFSAVAAFLTTGIQTTIGLGIPLLPAPPVSRVESDVEASSLQLTVDRPGIANSQRRPATVNQSLSLVGESLDRLRESASIMQGPLAQSGSVATTSAATKDDLDLPQSELDGGDVIVQAGEVFERDFASRHSLLVSSSPELLSGEVADGFGVGFLLLAGLGLVAAFGIGTAVFVGQWVMFVLAMRELKPADVGCRQSLDQLLSRMEVKRGVDLLVSSRISEPVAFGVWRWKIVLPENLQQSLTDDELASLLAHEIAHLARGDVFWLHVGRFLTTALAWQRLNFLARRKWQAESEFLCDDWATHRSVDSVVLARCLTRVAEWRSDRSSGVIALPLAGQRSHLTERVERLLQTTRDDHRQRWSLRMMQSLALCMACGTLALSGPSVRPAEPSIAPSPRDVTLAAEEAGTDQFEIPGVADQVTTSLNDRLEVLAALDQASAELALEVALLTEELAELGPLLERSSHDPDVDAAAQQLLNRIATLSEVSNVDVKTRDSEETDADHENF